MSLLLLFNGFDVTPPVPLPPNAYVETRRESTFHVDLLKALMPPESYAIGPNLDAELTAEGAALDALQLQISTVLNAIVPNLGPMLEDWERVYGTPNACQINLNLTRQQRLAIVKAKINSGGTFTKQKAINIAAALGYNIQIVERSPRRFGAQFGTEYAGIEMAFVWDVVTTNNTITRRRFGAASGEPYSSWGNGLLECTLKPLAMAGTLLRFIYLN